MANYYASARTNYVQVEDIEGLKESLSRFPIGIYESHNGQGYCMLCECGDSGGWPYCAYDEEDSEILFDWETAVMPYIKPNEVLVIMEVGAEKLRYLVGWANAYVKDSDGEIHFTQISLDDIYNKAATEFGISKDAISQAVY